MCTISRDMGKMHIATSEMAAILDSKMAAIANVTFGHTNINNSQKYDEY